MGCGPNPAYLSTHQRPVHLCIEGPSSIFPVSMCFIQKPVSSMCSVLSCFRVRLLSQVQDLNVHPQARGPSPGATQATVPGHLVTWNPIRRQQTYSRRQNAQDGRRPVRHHAHVYLNRPSHQVFYRQFDPQHHQPPSRPSTTR